MRICTVAMYHQRDDFVQICILEKGADQSQPRKFQIMSCIPGSAKLLGLPGSGATETILSGALQPNTLEVPEAKRQTNILENTVLVSLVARVEQLQRFGLDCRGTPGGPKNLSRNKAKS